MCRGHAVHCSHRLPESAEHSKNVVTRFLYLTQRIDYTGGKTWQLCFKCGSAKHFPQNVFLLSSMFEERQSFHFQILKKMYFWDALIRRILFFIIQINDFWGDVSDTSAETKTPKYRFAHPRNYLFTF